MTGVDIRYNNGNQNFDLGNQNNYSPFLTINDGPIPSAFNRDFSNASNNSLVFTPVGGPPSAAVPGPLLLFGAGAAFGWSRRLRRKIKATA